MDKYKLETVNCPLCDSSEYSIYIKKAKELYNNLDEYFDVCKCNKCRHIFTNPRPTMGTIEYFYPDDAGYYQPQKYKERSGFKYEVYKQILNTFYGYKLETTASKLLSILIYFLKKRQLEASHIPTFCTNGKLLDIGSSYGAYLKDKENIGWEVFGIELNQNAVKYAKNDLKLKNIQSDFFENTIFESNYFDAINMHMVLEHVYDPKLVIKKINEILKEEGELMISVPDISGFEAKIYRKYAYTLQVPEHLHHFSPKTITKLLEDNGFKVQKIIHQNFDRDLVVSSEYMPNKTLAKFLHNKLIKKTFVKAFVSFLALIGKTSRMNIYAKKVS